MENKKTYHVTRNYETSKQTIKNVAAFNKNGHNAKMENQRPPISHTNETIMEESDNQSTKMKITETYDEILDLRNAYIPDDNQSQSFKKTLDQNYLTKLTALPKMHYKIMSLCAVKNSKKFSETFNTKTDIIAERIVNKQQELEHQEKTKPKSKSKHVARAPQYPVRLNEKCVAQRIFNTQKELRKIEKVPIKTIARVKYVKSKLLDEPLPKPSRGILKPSRESSEQSVKSVRSLNRERISERYKPRFQLSTKPTGGRCKISSMSVQANMETLDNITLCTQTEDLRNLRNENIQTSLRELTKAKTIQTRIYKTNSMETSPIIIVYPEKYTNTLSEFPSAEQSTQMYEHFTMSDLFCLDWVNKHLFTVSLNPFNIVVDDKIKDVSEIASKSTFLTDIKLPRYINMYE